MHRGYLTVRIIARSVIRNHRRRFHVFRDRTAGMLMFADILLIVFHPVPFVIFLLIFVVILVVIIMILVLSRVKLRIQRYISIRK